MKILKYILFSIPFLTASCDTDDDGFYNRVYLESAQPLVIVAESDAYQVGNPIWVQANIPAVLDVVDQEEDVDLRETSNASSFDCTFVLERQNGSTWEVVDVSDSVVNSLGLAIGGSFVEATAVYDPAVDAYLFEGGVTINQTGNYRISFTYNNNLTDRIELFSNSPGNNIRINIKSPTDQLDDAGYYNFTVE